MDLGFSSLNELYERLIPALNVKVNELIRNKYNYIKKEDIWNYLKDNKWSNARNLTLADMVDDILYCDNIELDKYLKSKMNDQTREVHFEDLDNLL